MGYYVKICPKCNVFNNTMNNMCYRCGFDIRNLESVYYEEIAVQEEPKETFAKPKIDKVVLTVIGIMIILSLTPILFSLDSPGYITINTSSSKSHDDTEFEFIKAIQSDGSLKVYAKFTNNTKEDKESGYLYKIEAFQNGVQLTELFFADDDSIYNDQKKIEPGQSIEIVSIFVLEDKSEVKIKGKTWFTDEEIFTRTINIK